MAQPTVRARQDVGLNVKRKLYAGSVAGTGRRAPAGWRGRNIAGISPSAVRPTDHQNVFAKAWDSRRA